MNTQTSSLKEESLILLCIEQLPYNAEGFEELVKRYQKQVFAMCRRYLATEGDAEDATQEIFMKVFHSLPSFEHRSTFKTWLFSITINHCKTLLSNKKRHDQHYVNDERLVSDYEAENSDTAVLAEAASETDCVQGVIAKMLTDERDLLLLRFNCDMSLEEISGVLGKKLSATKMRFYRTLEKFKNLHEKYCT